MQHAHFLCCSDYWVYSLVGLPVTHEQLPVFFMLLLPSYFQEVCTNLLSWGIANACLSCQSAAIVVQHECHLVMTKNPGKNRPLDEEEVQFVDALEAARQEKEQADRKQELDALEAYQLVSLQNKYHAHSLRCTSCTTH